MLESEDYEFVGAEMKALILVSGWSSGSGIEWKASPIAMEAAYNGYKVIRFKPCNNGWGDIRHNGKKLARLVSSLRFESDFDEIAVLGHSMGGLVARYADIELTKSGETGIDAVVTIGTPHQGVPLGHMAWFSTSAKQMGVGSEFLYEINHQPARHSARYMALACRKDLIVWPRNHAFWEGAAVNRFINHGHVSAIFSTRVAKEVMEFFTGSETMYNIPQGAATL